MKRARRVTAGVVTLIVIAVIAGGLIFGGPSNKSDASTPAPPASSSTTVAASTTTTTTGQSTTGGSSLHAAGVDVSTATATAATLAAPVASAPADRATVADVVPADACKGIVYQGLAPAVDGIAFGPDVRESIANFDQLDVSGKTVAVTNEQIKAWCGLAGHSLTGSYHRGILPWPTSNEDWLNQLAKVNGDRNEQAKLVNGITKWEAECVASKTVVDDNSKYRSDWYNRTSGTPVLVQGPGHDDVRGWVIRREVKQTTDCRGYRGSDPKPFTTLDERLFCLFQLAEDEDFPIPLPPLPPGLTPPTTANPHTPNTPENPNPPDNPTPPSSTPPGSSPPSSDVPKDPCQDINDAADGHDCGDASPAPPGVTGPGSTPVGVDPGPAEPPVDSPTGCDGPCPTDPPVTGPPATGPPATPATTLPPRTDPPNTTPAVTQPVNTAPPPTPPGP